MPGANSKGLPRIYTGDQGPGKRSPYTPGTTIAFGKYSQA